MDVKSRSELPPGFRFHPTDEELIMFYLRNQVMSRPCPVSIIPEVDIYKFDPWELPDKTDFREGDQWYFFTPRDRKYPNGVRPNRASVSGYWKATGTDKAIYSGSKYVGVKKALVFYKGRPPKGTKTDWIMHEYRLCDSRTKAKKQNGSMRLDDWVLCRIYKKRHTAKPLEHQNSEDLGTQIVKKTAGCDAAQDQQQMLKFARTCSLAQLLEMENWGPISQLLSDSTSLNSNSNFDFQNSMPNSGTQNIVGKTQPGEVAYPYADSGKFQVNQSSMFSYQPIFMNPMAYDFQ